MSHRIVTILFVITLVAISGCQKTRKPPDAMVLINLEKDFSTAVAEKGMKDGFLQYLADDGVIFNPTAVNGKEHYESSEASPGLLTWQPSFAEISAAGDLGWTTGPWEFRRESMSDAPLVSGHYVTIWKLQADSVWKLVLDIGIPHGPLLDTAGMAMTSTLPSLNEVSTPEENKAELLQVEKDLSSMANSPAFADAYRDRIAEDIRYYRSGVYPVRGADSVMPLVESLTDSRSWQPDFTRISKDGTLGYTYGTGTVINDSGESQFSFAHIWRKNPDGQWKLALDIQIPK